MNEASLKRGFMRRVRLMHPDWMAQRHEDVLASGWPDVSVTGGGTTTWIEAKFADPSLDSAPVQEIVMRRLERAGNARYVIYSLEGGAKATHVILPSELAAWKADRSAFAAAAGFDHGWAARTALTANVAGEREAKWK